MDDSQKWRDILAQVKKKGRRRVFLKKSLSGAFAVLVFMIGVWQLFLVPRYTPKPNYQEYKDAEIVFYTEENVVYDRDLGYVSVSLNE